MLDKAGQDHDARVLHMRFIFNSVDSDGNGTLDTDEVAQIYARLGIPPMYQVEDLVAELDADGDGFISFEEFSAWFVTLSLTADEAVKTQQVDEESAQPSTAVKRVTKVKCRNPMFADDDDEPAAGPRGGLSPVEPAAAATPAASAAVVDRTQAGAASVNMSLASMRSARTTMATSMTRSADSFASSNSDENVSPTSAKASIDASFMLSSTDSFMVSSADSFASANSDDALLSSRNE